MKSALLFRFGGLGDLLVALPSISLVRKKLPTYSLTLVCRKEYGLILKEAGAVDNIISADKPFLAPLFSSSSGYPEDLSRWLKGYSLILGWMQKKPGLSIENIILYDPSFPGTISQYFFEKTAEFLSFEKGRNPSLLECCYLSLSPRLKEDGLKLLGEKAPSGGNYFAVLHPGSGSEKKCWPLDNFIEIASRLSQKGIRGALVTGTAESAIEKKLEKISLPPRCTWLRNPPLLELSGLLSEACLYLGNDSGITHLAAACGTNVLVLFLKELEKAWKPCGRTTVIRAESLPDITVDSAWETLPEIP